MSLEEFLGAVRAFLAAIGGYAVAHGIGSSDLWISGGGLVVALITVGWSILHKRGLLPLLLLAPLLGGCNLAQVASLTPALFPATSCAMDLAAAAEAHAGGAEPDAQKAVAGAVALLTDPQCQATLLALAAAAKG